MVPELQGKLIFFFFVSDVREQSLPFALVVWPLDQLITCSIWFFRLFTFFFKLVLVVLEPACLRCDLNLVKFSNKNFIVKNYPRIILSSSLSFFSLIIFFPFSSLLFPYSVFPFNFSFQITLYILWIQCLKCW